MARKRIHDLDLATTVEALDEFMFSRFESLGTRRISFSDILNNLVQMTLPAVSDPPSNSILAMKNGIDNAINSVDELQVLVDRKVEQVAGKGLSTNDFTDTYRDKLRDELVSGSTFNYADATTSKHGLMSTDHAKKVSLIGNSSNISTDNDLYAYIATSGHNGVMSRAQASKLAALPTADQLNNKIGFGEVKLSSGGSVKATTGGNTLTLKPGTNISLAAGSGDTSVTINGPSSDKLVTSEEKSVITAIKNAKGSTARFKGPNGNIYSWGGSTPYNGLLTFTNSGTAKVTLTQSSVGGEMSVNVHAPSREWKQIPGSPVTGKTALEVSKETYSMIYVLVLGGATNNQEYYTSFFIPSVCRTYAFILTNNYPAVGDLAKSGYVAINVGVSTISINTSFYGGVDRTTSAKMYVYGLERT